MNPHHPALLSSINLSVFIFFLAVTVAVSFVQSAHLDRFPLSNTTWANLSEFVMSALKCWPLDQANDTCNNAVIKKATQHEFVQCAWGKVLVLGFHGFAALRITSASKAPEPRNQVSQNLVHKIIIVHSSAVGSKCNVLWKCYFFFF